MIASLILLDMPLSDETLDPPRSGPRRGVRRGMPVLASMPAEAAAAVKRMATERSSSVSQTLAWLLKTRLPTLA